MSSLVRRIQRMPNREHVTLTGSKLRYHNEKSKDLLARQKREKKRESQKSA
jgi:hypothetical protein